MARRTLAHRTLASRAVASSAVAHRTGPEPEASTSARRTHFRNVSGIIPNFVVIDVIVAHSDGCAAWSWGGKTPSAPC